MSNQPTKLYAGLVPRPGWITVFFRAGTSREDGARAIKENSGVDSVPISFSLGTGFYVAVPVGQELEFVGKFRLLLEIDDATVEYIKKE